MPPRPTSPAGFALRTAAFYAAILGVGGIQMPFGAVFLVLVRVLFVNKPLQALNRGLGDSGLIRVFSAVEIMTVYVMVLFGALVSTPGCDNQFMSMGPGLFYFQTR